MTKPQDVEDAAKLGVAVVGCGYWGPNLVRNFSACDQTRVAAICDQDAARLARVARSYPGVKQRQRFDEVLADKSVDAVAIATPVSTHGELAMAALNAGKHVLVEKPMGATVAEAEAMLALAREKGLTLMVDHVFIYSPPVRKIKQLIDAGELGDIYYIDSVRINLGLIQKDVNVLWDLAPHDLSIVDYFLSRLPRSLAATGTCHTGSRQEDVAYLNLDFGDNLIATFHVNWLSPVKVRHIIIGGSKKSLVYNDLDPVEPVKVYDHGIDVATTLEAKQGIMISYRTGDIWSPNLPREEPLQNMVRQFVRSIREKQEPPSGGEAGLRVVRILEASQRSIKAQGGRITL